MKVAQPRTQFDRPESIATPATPSCCCCCCCLATIVSSTAMGAITAHHQAQRFTRPSGWPIVLALLAVPAGLLAASAAASTSGDGIVAVVIGSLVALVLWFFAFDLAVPGPSSSALGRSVKYLVLFAVCFGIELFVGFFLVIFYVVPYLIVAGIVTYAAISGHLRRQRSELSSGIASPPIWNTPPPTWDPPLPPPDRPSSFEPPPPGSDTPGFDESRGFEPPAGYQLPGYPEAPPQADGPPPSPPTYRPGNPATASSQPPFPEPPLPEPTDEPS